ncbi:hypothetical protein [Nonlabens ponticola]|uniref:Tissue inhibitor of metalloproteinase n=1 Tax=Nonlabens ponticola TaxID=2496866 RepID=A0A3S9MU94_9FLAO|nr:hypothetical protein [Nonlabens ponticola]AZQ42744.1 hypothetical protein EJ995_00250 [Nonlabens ponticola]
MLLFICAGLSAAAQSCVCVKKDLLNDFKDTDFIAVVTITSKEVHEFNPDVDVLEFTVQELFKGKPRKQLLIFQKTGFGKNNDACRLYLEPGDELLLFANEKANYLYTIPCYRNKKLSIEDAAYQDNLLNDILILRQLQPFTSVIESTTTRCNNINADVKTRDVIEDISLHRADDDQRMGLYKVKFTPDNLIDRITVVAPFNEDIDKAVRIALIKRKWQPCELGEKRELILGYFYNPKTEYQKAFLSSL